MYIELPAEDPMSEGGALSRKNWTRLCTAREMLLLSGRRSWKETMIKLGFRPVVSHPLACIAILRSMSLVVGHVDDLMCVGTTNWFGPRIWQN